MSAMDVFSAALLSICLITLCCESTAQKHFEMPNGKAKLIEEKQIFLEESYLTPKPPTIEIDDNGIDGKNDINEVDKFVGREMFDDTDATHSKIFAKKERFPPEEHELFSSQTNPLYQPIMQWSSWTCCRSVVNLQSRKRMTYARKIEASFRRCTSNYCSASECKEDTKSCKKFIILLTNDVCHPTNQLVRFMSRNCPKTCKFCGGPTRPEVAFRRTLTLTPKKDRTFSTTKATTTAVPWWKVLATKATQKPVPWRIPTRTPMPYRPRYTTVPTTKATTTPTPYAPSWQQNPPVPSHDSTMVKITVLKHNLNPKIPSYKFVVDSPVVVTPPWTKVTDGSSTASSFKLSRVPSGIFQTPIAFCSGVDSFGIEKWSIVRTKCQPGWEQKYLLYGASKKAKSTIPYIVGSRQAPARNSEVSKKIPNIHFRFGIFFFYGQNSQTESVKETPRPIVPRPTPRPRPSYTVTNPPRYSVPVPNYFPSPRHTQQMNSFNRECLEAHNFFRAVHNVPPLQWSAKLTKSAQKWADELKDIAPERPNSLVKPHLRTSNWPHSEAGSEFRDVHDGENIAWDLSADGSPAKESILRFYSEIFYYNRKHPTYSPGRDKPVGHVTQLLWKDTTELGCGIAKSRLGRFNSQSTWTVVHYSPGGNHRYRSSGSKTLELYNVQVPDMRSGSCMTRSGRCNRGNQCMAFGPARGKCTCTSSGTPECSSTNGCIAWCENKYKRWPWKEECQGKYECKCTKNGAVCQ